MVCIQVDVNERSPKPRVCILYDTRTRGSCRVEVDAVVESEVSPVFLLYGLFAQVAAGAMRLSGC